MTVIDRPSVFDALDRLTSDGSSGTIAGLYAPDAEVRVTSPFHSLVGRDAIRDVLWAPLRRAFTSLQRRSLLFLAQDGPQGDTGLDAPKVATIGHLVGRFTAPWCGLEPTGEVVFLRFAEIHEFDDGRVARTTMYLDMVDLARQVGRSILAPARGREVLWPAPDAQRCGAGLMTSAGGEATTKATLARVRAMQHDLHDDATTRADMVAAAHLRHWDANFWWYGPGGIGTTRGADGFVDDHQLPFRTALPDRVGGGVTKGHFAKFADGRLACTAGWPSVRGTHLGDGWLGLVASGRSVDLRVTDFYALTGDDLIFENWVLIDLVHLCEQLDIPTGLVAPC